MISNQGPRVALGIIEVSVLGVITASYLFRQNGGSVVGGTTIIRNLLVSNAANMVVPTLGLVGQIMSLLATLGNIYQEKKGKKKRGPKKIKNIVIPPFVIKGQKKREVV